MSKRLFVFIALLFFVVGGASADVEKVVFFAPVSTSNAISEKVFSPWGCGESSGERTFVTYKDGGNDSDFFETAFVVCRDPVLKVGSSTRFEVKTTGGVSPFVYEYDVYFQPFGKETRSYSGELHEVSLNSYLDITPRKEGRYIVVVKVSDSAGSEITFDSDAIPTDKNGEISAIIERVAADALATGAEYGTVEYIHNWIMCNAEYNSTQSGKYEADSIFLDGCGVCSGYASAFNMLCAACGIESFSVHGYATAQPMSGKEHSWNCVKIDNDFYFCDVTADDGNGFYDGGFFLMTSATCEQTHCFGIGAGAFSDCGGACLPPRCNATMYAESYDEDPVATDIRIRCGDEYPTSIEMSVGASCRLVGATTPSCSRHPSKIWSASNAKVASIDNCGILTANAVGRCIITITCGELSASVEIIVK